jgi:ABC-type uncharacterized transport system involved in gliding motility auxiliary subunit
VAFYDPQIPWIKALERVMTENNSVHDKGNSFLSKVIALLSLLLPLFIVVMVVLLSERHYHRWDLTSTGEHTLSEETIQVLKGITRPIRITAFVREGYEEKDEAERLLSTYHYYSPKISYRLIDPDRNPTMTNKYGVKSINTMVLEGYGRKVKILIADEENITNGIIRLITGQIQKICWVTGHGERAYKGSDPGTLSVLYESLKDQNYEFQEISLMKSQIPRDCSLLVISAPVKPFLPQEISALKRYMDSGGSLLIFLEPFMDGGLSKFLSEYGILIVQDIVVDKVVRIMGGDYLMPMVTSYGHHRITDKFRLGTIFPTVRSVVAKDEMIGKLRLSPIVFTSTVAWAERDIEDLREGKITLGPEDKKGPVSIAVVCEIKSWSPRKDGSVSIHGPVSRGKIVVFGDVDFATNKYIKFLGNEDLIKNTINFLAERGGFITIKKRYRPIEALMLTKSQGRVIFWVAVVFMPMGVFIAGVVVWIRRRSK